MVDPTTLPELFAAFANYGGSYGANQPVLKGAHQRHLHHVWPPVILSEKVPQLGEEGDISLFDFSKYVIGLRQDTILKRAITPGWDSDEMDFRIKVRVAGQGKWSSVVTPKNGDSLSWAVLSRSPRKRKGPGSGGGFWLEG